jgi:hypothetical protein
MMQRSDGLVTEQVLEGRFIAGGRVVESNYDYEKQEDVDAASFKNENVLTVKTRESQTYMAEMVNTEMVNKTLVR